MFFIYLANIVNMLQLFSLITFITTVRRQKAIISLFWDKVKGVTAAE